MEKLKSILKQIKEEKSGEKPICFGKENVEKMRLDSNRNLRSFHVENNFSNKIYMLVTELLAHSFILFRVVNIHLWLWLSSSSSIYLLLSLFPAFDIRKSFECSWQTEIWPSKYIVHFISSELSFSISRYWGVSNRQIGSFIKTLTSSKRHSSMTSQWKCETDKIKNRLLSERSIITAYN